MRSSVRALLAVSSGAAASRIALAALGSRPPGGAVRWTRTNYAGRPVTRVAGPAYVVGAVVAAAASPTTARVRRALVVAAVSAGVTGLYDDLYGDEGTRGLRGHLTALGRGDLTTGVVKILGIGAAGLAAGWLVRDGTGDRLAAAVLVAGTANAVNLLDLRPGRALKSGLVVGVPALLGSAMAPTAAALAPVAALLRPDLDEGAMLGDGGASAFGAALGVAFAAYASPRRLRRRAAVAVALTLASEVVSFTAVIDALAPLRWFDRWGQR